MENFDPHQRPPDGIRNVYKKYQKMKLQDLKTDSNILDLSSGVPVGLESKIRVVKYVDADQLTTSFRAFAGGDYDGNSSPVTENIAVYEHGDMPGRFQLILVNH
jgi:alkylated DNA repair protein alkB family protein 1